MGLKLRWMIAAVFVLSATIIFFSYSGSSPATIHVRYPFDGTLYPRDMAPPEFAWTDDSDAQEWKIRFVFADGSSVTCEADTTRWTPSRDLWIDIKARALEKSARVTISGLRPLPALQRKVSAVSLSITVSSDEVGAPVFYRLVPLPFSEAAKRMDTIRWCIGDISSENPPETVLANLPVCGNCHSFSRDGSVMGMDVDYANDKGSYMLAAVSDTMAVGTDDIITWSDSERPDGVPTFGLLSQVSPDGRYALSTVRDRSVFIPVDDLEYSQLFFPIRGILALYDRRNREFSPFRGADDPRYVQSNPVWSPDGSRVLFARCEADTVIKAGNQVLIDEELGSNYLSRENLFKYDLYSLPFNGGDGGVSKPVPGASGNGKSNYFPKISPDGRWLVFCQAESFMLLQRDSRLFIMPAQGGEPREMSCNMPNMNSWHSWSPNGKWLVFSSKAFTPYTQLMLTHIDEDGNDTPPVVLTRLSPPDRAVNIPEFVPNVGVSGFKRIDERFVDDVSYVRAAESALYFNDTTYGLALLRRAVEKNPANAHAWDRLGILLASTGNADEAEHAFREGIRLLPGELSAYGNLGSMYMEEGRTAEAETLFREAIRRDPSYAPPHYFLGLLKLKAGDSESARVCFERAIAADSAFSEAHLHLGTIYLERGEFDKAQTGFEKAIAADPDNVGALYNLGIIRMNRSDFAGAEKIFRDVAERFPENAQPWYLLGEITAMRPGGEREAAQLFRKCLKRDPTHFDGLIALGNASLRLNDRAGALDAFSRALSLHPGDNQLENSVRILHGSQ